MASPGPRSLAPASGGVAQDHEREERGDDDGRDPPRTQTGFDREPGEEQRRRRRERETPVVADHEVVPEAEERADPAHVVAPVTRSACRERTTATSAADTAT